MRRRITNLAVMFFVGCAVTLAIALVLPLYPVRTYTLHSGSRPQGQSELPAFMSRWSGQPRVLQQEEYFGATQVVLRVIPDSSQEGSLPGVAYERFEYGLPLRFLSARHFSIRDGTASLTEVDAIFREVYGQMGWRAQVPYPSKSERFGYMGPVRIPLFVHPVGLVCNAVFWATVVFLPVFFWKLVVRTDRHLKLKCASCGYPRGKASDSAVCTECGRPHSLASSNASTS
jgi:hypothetical protein